MLEDNYDDDDFPDDGSKKSDEFVSDFGTNLGLSK